MSAPFRQAEEQPPATSVRACVRACVGWLRGCVRRHTRTNTHGSARQGCVCGVPRAVCAARLAALDGRGMQATHERVSEPLLEIAEGIARRTNRYATVRDIPGACRWMTTAGPI